MQSMSNIQRIDTSCRKCSCQ